MEQTIKATEPKTVELQSTETKLPTKRAKRPSLASKLETVKSFAGVSIANCSKIEDVAPDLPIYSATEMLDVPLLLQSWEFREGDYGKYAVMCCKLEDGTDCLVMCGGVVVMRKLQELEDAGGTGPYLTGFTAVGGGKGKNPTILLV